jgi:ABC-type antimicrobial peptide transport system permease subunit
MAIPLVYNIRNVIQRPVGTLTTAAGIGLTVAILIASLALAIGFRTTLVASGSPDNVIVLRKGADSEISSGIGRGEVEILRALPDVATGPGGRPQFSAEMVVVSNLKRIGQPGSSNVTLRGVDLASIGVRATPRMVAGRMFTPGTDEVVVGNTIAPRFEHCAIGDRIVFQKRPFTVVGHFATGGSSLESEIWGDANVLMPVMHREDAYQVALFRMKDPSRFDALKLLIERDPRLGVQVDREDRFYEGQSAALTAVLGTVGVFITVIMSVGALFGAANTMFASIGARTREIATLLVLGFRPGAIRTSFVIESVLIGLIGGVLGCLIALPINGITTSTTNFQSFSEVAFAFRVTPLTLGIGMAFAAGMGLVGGFLPAWHASRQSLAAALRKA